MTAVDESHTIEFRRSTRRVVLVAVALLVVAAGQVAFNLTQGRQWWDGIWLLPLYVVIFTLAKRLGRPAVSGYQARLPLQLTEEHLQVAGPGEVTVSIGWSNIARAEIHGRLLASLVIEPIDPDRTHPPLKRWQWAGHGQSRPHEILVPLTHMTPGRDVLRRELAQRTAAARHDI
ncbi:hypothetical protein MRQ36_27230 [Micromonospora sp. R77]|uniref:hypothetical protein n=1 Tax=Micromonospora sp. R77 TaxID=2925836 RepID=UPI001F619B71|nr:hypothetical protein [Micromonospora sp. R77]MCI4066043.1 hypothetical protein [Micromonospora sp. R77]